MTAQTAIAPDGSPRQFDPLEVRGLVMARRAGNPVFGAQGTTIFTAMSALAASCGAINLGQGFPDRDGPLAIREAAAACLREGPNQYPPMNGLPDLRNALAAHAARNYNLEFDPESEILVTSGATEALAASFMALTAQGDEAIVIEPAYDSYRPILEAAGAEVKVVRLHPPHFRLEEAALAQAFSPRTKLIAVNSPMNPTGRVLSLDELELLAGFLRRYDAYAVCDEVYEHLVFDHHVHRPLIALPGMRARCVRIGSAGKMFSLTGWKVGWVEGAPDLIDAIAKTHQFLTFTTSPALQLGVAYGLEHEMNFTTGLARELQTKRDVLGAALARAGFEVLPSEGTYFLTAGTGSITEESDLAFCLRLTREVGVAAIPFSSFYHREAPTDLVRFAFCKQNEVLQDAAARLERSCAGAVAR